MKYISGVSRNQLILFSESIDLSISHDNEVRLIDLFVESLDGKGIQRSEYQEQIENNHLS